MNIKPSKSGKLLILLTIVFVYQINAWCLRSRINEGNSKPIKAVDFSKASEDFVVIARQDKINVYNQTTLHLIGGVTAGDKVESVAFSKVAGGYFAVGYSDKDYIRLYDSTSFPFAQKSCNTGGSGTGRRGLGLDFNDNGNKLIVCGDKNDAKQMSSFNSATLGSVNGNFSGSNPGSDCQYSPNGIIGVTFSNKVLAYGPGNFQLTFNKNCKAIDFCPDNSFAIVGCTDSKGYQIRNGTDVGSSIFTDSGSVDAVAFAPDQSIFFMGGAGKMVALFYPNKTLMAKFPVDSAITTGRFDTTSSKLLVGTSGGYAYLFRKDCEFKCQPHFFMAAGSVCKLCNDEIPYCSECTSPTNCLGCVTGYVLSGGKCVKCSKEGCLQCTSDNTYCLVCEMGFFLNTTSKLCERCNSYIPYCLLCTSSTNCTKCDSISYYNSGTGKCTLCQTMTNRCLTCSSQNKCLSCQIGYYLVTTATTSTCNRCPANCVACNRTTQCLQCSSGYYITTTFTGTNNCVKCANGCVNCNNTGTCIECEQGKFLDESKNCVQCTYPCSICNATDKCYGCMNGYFLSGTSCTVCDAGCKTCNQTGKCLTCWQGNNLDANSKCVSCSKLYNNCSVCSTTGCLMCREGYFYDSGTSSCLNCLKTINNCMICKDASTCYQCSIGYYETGSTGNSSCKSCSLGCAKCISDTSCESCLSTFYYSSGKCLNCVAPCVTCVDSGSCLSCAVGYYLDSTDNKCKICYTAITNCLTCYNTSYCIGCQPGYYLNSAKSACLKCPSNCTTCESDTYCHTCQIGYYLGSTAKTCLKCKTQCATCQSESVCQKCISGYYLDDSDSKCKKCTLSNCLQCSTASECVQCSDGTFLDTLATSATYKKCILCDKIVSNCMLCNDIKQCTLCSYEFGLAADKLSCQSCASNILGCTHCQKISSCLTCEAQFYLSDLNSDNLNQCTPCAKGCRTCTSDSICQSCYQGLYLDGTGKCLTCQQEIQGCQVCDNSTGTVQCLSCKKQYYNVSTTQCNLCSKAMNGCLYCDVSSDCLLCESGLYLEDSSKQCKPCSDVLDNCQLCSSQSVCLQCENGYFLDSTVNVNKCKKCTSTLFGCLSCANDTHCSLCDSQTYLDPTTKTCLSCAQDIFGCISCTADLKCIQCDSGFYLKASTNKCEKCQQKGCQICYESDPLKCITCNSLYVLDETSKICKSCNSLVPGCIECQNGTGTVKCNECMIGFYHDLSGQCKLCSSSNQGCVRCVDQNHCIECESLYFLSQNSTHSYCTLCSLPIDHCDVCNTSAQCLQCKQSYFLSADKKSCSFCSQYIENCIYCESQATCILCDSKYFIQGGKCEKCSSHLTGCYSCVDATHCTACKNGYSYDSNTTSCLPIQLAAPQPPVQTLKLKSYYESKQVLRHVLFSQGMKFNKTTTQIASLMKQISIVMKDKALISYQLVILSWQVSNDLYSIVFFTNNPIDFEGILEKNSSKHKMQFRRLQQYSELSDLNIDTDLKIPQQVSRQLLPELDYNSDVQVNYNLNGPQFYNSLVENSSFFQCKYFIFGYVVLSVLLVKFMIKIFYSAKNSLNCGQIIPHIIAIKTVSVAVYPAHFEMVSFAKGFMLYDIPWANQFFGSVFGSTFDFLPQGYKLFYSNLNIGSTYFIALILILIIVVIDRFLLRKKKKEVEKPKEQDEERSQLEDNSQKFKKWFKDNKPLQPTQFQTLYTNIFGFSFTQLTLCSFIGAIYSDFPDLGVNFFMYLIGTCLYFVIMLHTIYVSFRNFSAYSNNLRTFLKATTLTLTYLAPIYLVVVAFLLDSVLILIQYQYSQYGLNNAKDKNLSVKKLFYISQFMANLSLLFIFLINSRLISFVITVLFISICAFIEFFLHYKEYKNPYKSANKLNQSSQSNLMLSENDQMDQSNVFENFKTKQNYNQTKKNFNETNYSSDITTIAPRKTLRYKKNPRSFTNSYEKEKNSGFFNDI